MHVVPIATLHSCLTIWLILLFFSFRLKSFTSRQFKWGHQQRLIDWKLYKDDQERENRFKIISNALS